MHRHTWGRITYRWYRGRLMGRRDCPCGWTTIGIVFLRRVER